MKRLIFILFGLWIMAFGLWGQETIVVGEVYDANTGEPLPNVNIYLTGSGFAQMDNLLQYLKNFSYVSKEYLNEEDLICLKAYRKEINKRNYFLQIDWQSASYIR